MLEFRRVLFRSDRKSTRLNSSHTIIWYAVFCLKKKNAFARRDWVGTGVGGRGAVDDVAALPAPLPRCRRFVAGAHQHQAHAAHLLFFFNDTATTEIYTLSLHDALPI